MNPIYEQQTCDWIHARGMLIDTNLQAMDIKHLAEFENIYRRRCRLAIDMYKDWLREYKTETDIVELLYGSIEGMMLRQQAVNAVKLYWMIRMDFREALNKYLSKVSTYRPIKYAA